MVIAIIAVLIALLLPAVQAAREAARRIQCVNNLKQIGLAVQNYHDAHSTLPPGYTYLLGYSTGGFGWASMILPYMEQTPVFNAINFNLPAWSSQNSTACTQSLNSYQCPTDYTVDEGLSGARGFPLRQVELRGLLRAYRHGPDPGRPQGACSAATAGRGSRT